MSAQKRMEPEERTAMLLRIELAAGERSAKRKPYRGNPVWTKEHELLLKKLRGEE